MLKWIEGLVARVCYSARWSIYVCQTFGSKEITNDKNCTHPKKKKCKVYLDNTWRVLILLFI